MPEPLSDKLRNFSRDLQALHKEGQQLDTNQIYNLFFSTTDWCLQAREMEYEISRLTRKLEVRTDALNTVCANLDRAEALLRNGDHLHKVSNNILDEIDRPGTNVCLMERPSKSGGDAA